MNNQVRPDQRIDIVIGAPGTGKSTFMQQLIAKKKEEAAKAGKAYRLGYEFLILAPTGQAAKNVHGRTIHSLICYGRFNYGEFNQNGIIGPELAEHFKRNIKINSLQDIYIDEVAAIDYKLIKNLDRLLQYTLNNYRQPFGGVNIIATGDPMQIQPVNGETAFLYEDFTVGSHIKVLKENKRFSGELLDVITDAETNKYVNFKNIKPANPEDILKGKHVIVDTNKKRYKYNSQSINYEKKNFINIYFDEKDYKESLENENVRPEVLAPDREIILKSNRAVNDTNFEYNGDRATLTSIGVYDYKDNIESSEYERRLFKSEKHFDIANKTEDVVVVFKYLHKCYVPEEDKEYEHNKYAIYRAYVADGTYVCTKNLRRISNTTGGFFEEKLGTPFIDSFAITAHIAQGATIKDKYSIDLSSNSAAASSAYVALTRANDLKNIISAQMSKSSRRIDCNMWAINHVLIQNDGKKFSRDEFTKMVNTIQKYAVPFDKENATDLAIKLQEATNWPVTDYDGEKHFMASTSRKLFINDDFFKEMYHLLGRVLIKNPDLVNEEGVNISFHANMPFQDIRRNHTFKHKDGKKISTNQRSTSTMVTFRVASKKDLKKKGNKNPLQSATDFYISLIGFTVDVDGIFHDNPKRDIKRVIEKIKRVPIKPNMITVSGNDGMHFKYLLKTPILLDKNIRGGYNTAQADINNNGFILADRIKRVIEYICWYMPLSDDLGTLGGKEQSHQGVNQGTTITGSLTKKNKKAVTFVVNSLPVLTPETICNIIAKYEYDSQLFAAEKSGKKIEPKKELNRAEFLDLLYAEQDIFKIFEETQRVKLTGQDKQFKEDCKFDRYDKYNFCNFVKKDVIIDKATAVPNSSQEKQIVEGIKFFSDVLIRVPYKDSFRKNFKEALQVFGSTASGLNVPKNVFARELDKLVDLGLPRDILSEAFEYYDANKGNTSAKRNASVRTYIKLLGNDVMKAYKQAKSKQTKDKQNTFRNSEIINVNDTCKKVIENIKDYKPSYNSPKYKDIYKELCTYGITSFEILEQIINKNYNSIKVLAKRFANKKIVSKSMGNRYDRFLETIVRTLMIEEFKRDGLNFYNSKDEEKENQPTKKEKLFLIIDSIVGDCKHNTEELTSEFIRAKTEAFISTFVAEQSPAIVGRLSFYINNEFRLDTLKQFYDCIDWKVVNLDQRFRDKVALNRKNKAGTNRGTINKAALFTSDSDLVRAYERLSIPGYTYTDLSSKELKAIKAPILEQRANLNKLIEEDPENSSIVEILIKTIDDSLGSINDAQKQVKKLKTAQEIIDSCTQAKTTRDNRIKDFNDSPEGVALIQELRQIDAKLVDLLKSNQIIEMNFDKDSLNDKSIFDNFKSHSEYLDYKEEKLTDKNTKIAKEMYNLLLQGNEIFNKIKPLIDMKYYEVNISPEENNSVSKVYKNQIELRKAISSFTSDKIVIKTNDLRVEKNHIEWNKIQNEGYGKQITQIFEDRKQLELEKEQAMLKHAQKLEKEMKEQEEIHLAQEKYRNSMLPHLVFADK